MTSFLRYWFTGNPPGIGANVSTGAVRVIVVGSVAKNVLSETMPSFTV